MAVPIVPHLPQPEFLSCHELAQRWGKPIGAILQYGAFNGLPFSVFLSESLVDREGKAAGNLSGLCPVKDYEVREIIANGSVEIDTTLLLARNPNFEQALGRADLPNNSFAFEYYAQKRKSLLTSSELGCLWSAIECFESNLIVPVRNWLDSDPAFVTDAQLREVFHGTHPEWEELFAKLENDILQGRLSAEIAVKKGNDFKVIESITERGQIRNGWLGGGWVNYTMKTADAAAWFKGKYEIPIDSMLGRLFAVSSPLNCANLAPQLPSTLDGAASRAATPGGSFLGIKRFKDDWARLIDDTARLLFSRDNVMPNETQMWQAMLANTVPGYPLKISGGSLTMPDNTPLSRKDFGERWRKLMAKRS